MSWKLQKLTYRDVTTGKILHFWFLKNRPFTVYQNFSSHKSYRTFCEVEKLWKRVVKSAVTCKTGRLHSNFLKLRQLVEGFNTNIPTPKPKKIDSPVQSKSTCPT